MSQHPYTIEVDQVIKTVHMAVNGVFSQEEYDSFVKDYIAKTSSIQASSFTLKVDCTQMALLGPGEVEKLKGSFARYKETGFAKIIFVISLQQTIIKMQLGRVAREAGLNNVDIVVQ
ncbi:hypothetical protein ACT3XG_16020 [Paenibacillus polymyxa]|uniref:hypothetical protein n=1 Tax=Paenibacillus TaxID=44249 RepID=UPI0002FBA31E|nr:MULTISPECIES: hypothetical protein [Paenibacillus]MEB4782537.1 hypothetical protein [Paenibacillus jamilae]AHM66939.1 hypothetical protein PPSQR21_033000 [Paenibacillus polymyxa SQR-21]AIY07745.1 hypothetical protein LK13_03700 [Paenibacillus polymyxa]AUS27518.1 hypothetical protein C1A50_3353 [Paenibacillus polymyxa]KAF6585713.1 hypothetical protein G9G57_03155 [Paenibacillus sp. EKM211P]